MVAFILSVMVFARMVSAVTSQVPNENLRCEPYKGGVCQGVIGSLNVLQFDNDLEPRFSSYNYSEDLLKSFVNDVSIIASKECINIFLAVACVSNYAPCQVHGNQIVTFKRPCASACEHAIDTCADFVALVQNIPSVKEQIPSCKSSRFGTHSILSYPTPYPDSVQGQPTFPEESTLFSDGVEEQCVKNATVIDIAKPDRDDECDEGFATMYEGKCHVLCPFPWYTSSDYAMIKSVYVGSGFAGGMVCMYLLFDAWLVCYVFSQDTFIRRQRGSNLFKYQILGSMTGLVFFFSGPVMALNEDLGCKFGNVSLQILDPVSANGRDDTLMCSINRYSMFNITAILNLVFVCITSTLNQLKRASNKARRISVVSRKRRERFALFFAIVEPLLLAIITAQNDEPSTIMDAAQLARWSVMCGPRLTKTKELMLVHLPMFLPALGVMVQARNVFIYIRLLQTSIESTLSSERPEKESHLSAQSERSSVPSQRVNGSADKGNDAMLNALKVMTRSVAQLGMCLVLLLILFACTTYVIVQGLEVSSVAFADWIFCKLVPDMVAIFITAKENMLVQYDSCEQVKAATGNLPPSEIDFESKVPAYIFALSFGAQGVVVLVYGLYFLGFARQRAWTYKKSAVKRFGSIRKIIITGTKVEPAAQYCATSYTSATPATTSTK